MKLGMGKKLKDLIINFIFLAGLGEISPGSAYDSNGNSNYQSISYICSQGHGAYSKLETKV
jgi:hypothetical protein